MSFQHLSWAWEADVENAARKIILVALASYANEYGQCWPRQDTLAERTYQCERTIRTHLQWLEEQGYITREKRSTTAGRRSDLYQLHIEKRTVRAPKPATDAGSATGKREQTQPATDAGCSIHESPNRTTTEAVSVFSKETPIAIWKRVWLEMNAAGFGTNHRLWPAKWTSMAATLEKLCSGRDFEEVSRAVLTAAANDPWLEKRPDMFTCGRLLRPDVFEMYERKAEA